jgi:hypothetical protein
VKNDHSLQKLDIQEKTQNRKLVTSSVHSKDSCLSACLDE